MSSRSWAQVKFMPIPGRVGIQRGPRERAQRWATLPEEVSIQAVRQWMETLFDLPERWRVEAVDLMVRAVYHLPEPQRQYLTQIRSKALVKAAPERRVELLKMHVEVLARLPGWMRWEEEQILQKIASLVEREHRYPVSPESDRF